MKKLFIRFLIINLLIITAVFWGFNNYIVNQISDYLINQKEENLISQAQIIEREYYKFLSDGVIKYDKLTSELDAMERFLKTKMAFIDRNGAIFAESQSYDHERTELFFTDYDLERVFEGKIVIKKSSDFSVKDTSFLVIGYPLTFFDSTHFALLLDAEIPDVILTIQEINTITFFSIILTAIIIILVNFFNIKRFTSTINDINKGIKEIIKGNYEQRITFYRNDELGDLARNYNDMTKDLQNYEEMRKNFVSNLSHDLRTPLTSIHGFVQGIKDGTIPEEEKEKYLDIVLDESKRLIKMTNDVLDLSNFQSGGMKFYMESFDINALILNTLESMEQRILDKEITISLTFQEKLPDAYADSLKIQRVIYNLLDNAIKFSDEKSKITIQTFFENELLYVAINNYGEIIDLENLPLVFNRFTKLDDSRGKDKLGSGLGLSIVKEIIKGHNQNIYVESSDQTGVTFTFSLDYYKGVTQEDKNE